MLSKVLRTISEHRLLAPGDRVLVGVSGGPDSMALLHALIHLAPKLGLSLEAAVVDHALRPESASEAALVAGRCRAADVACEVLKVNVRAARGKHVSWQDAARRVRLGALEDLATRHSCTRIALGHTANDQAETILFRIVRGTGLSGLAGIPYQRGAFIRPLLDVKRADVLRFTTRRKISFVEDPSNADSRYARARIRHEWLPFFARENPRIVEALISLGDDARRTTEAGERVTPLTFDGVELPRRLRPKLERLVADGAGTRRLSIPGGELEVSYGRVRWSARASGRVAKRAIGTPASVQVPGPGVYRLPASPDGPSIEIAEEFSERGPSPKAISFDLSTASGPLVLRTMRPGDRMRPRGGRGSRKLQDLLVDAKIPRAARASLPVLTTADGTILFVPGLRPSEAGRPTAGTRRWIQVRVV